MRTLNLKTWVHYYVALLKNQGAFRFSLMLAFAIIAVDSLLQLFLAHYFNEPLDIVDVSRSFIFVGVITPLAVYFLTVIVGDLEEARESLNHTIVKLQVIVKNDQQKAIALESEIIERQKSQSQFEQSANLLRSFLDTSPDLFFHRDLKGCFVTCNKAMELLAGKTEPQLIGLTPFDIYPEFYASEVVQFDQTAKESQKEQIHEQWLHYPNGRKAYFEIRILPLYSAQKKCIGIIGFGRDITERKKNQEALEKASRDKTTFISTISHELRTPLNGIVGLSRMLLDEQLTEQQIKYLKTIHMSAVTLGNIFNDIVDLDKLDRRHLNLVIEHIDMFDFISDLKSLAFMQTEQKGLELSFEQSTLLPEYIDVDVTRLRQVLWNLISNAVKYTQQGSITVRCLCQQESTQSARLCFEVQDTGIGIPAELLDKVFTMYYQVKSSLQAGTGIGLAISSQIVEAMGGKLTVSSDLGYGSTFKFSILVSHSVKKEEPKMLLETQLSLSILLVEDIDLNILVTTSLLEKLGHTVDIAKNGAQALEKVANKEYQLIFMDIKLPDMDGYQVTKQLRQLYGDNLPPIVALTANVFADKQYFLSQGMDDALSKPLGVDALNKVIQSLFATETQIDQPEKAGKANVPGESSLDEAMLSELLDFIPASVMLDNVTLFEKMIPDYLQILDSNMTAKDKEGITSEAHKIKGAAGSIGLKRIQMLSQKVQSPDLPAWWDNIDDWVELIKIYSIEDIAELKSWLTARI